MNAPPRPRNRALITAAVLCGTVVSAMEMTIVGTAMARIVGTLGGSDRFAWVASIYLLTSTVSAPLAGKFADLYGRRPVYQCGMALFLVGSALSGAAPSMNALIVARAVQGIGGGVIATVALTITGDIFTPVERGRIQGLFSALWGTAGALGPLVGGIIVDRWNWRWVFYINIPFGVGAMILIAYALREDVARRHASLDVLGALVLTAAVALVELAAGGHAGVRAPVLGLLGIAAFGVFAWVESRAESPIVPLALLRDRLVGTAFLATLLAGGAMFDVIYFLPLYLQGVFGRTAGGAGMVMTPMMVAWPTMGLAAGLLIAHVDPRKLVRIGMSLVAIGAALPLAARNDPSERWFSASGLLVGAGMGLSSTPLLISLQSAVGWEMRGIVTAGFSFCRTMGGTLGVILAGAIYGARLASRGVEGSAIDALLRPGAQHATPWLRDALAFALHGGFVAVAALGLVALIAAMAFPHATVTVPARTADAPVAEP